MSFRPNSKLMNSGQTVRQLDYNKLEQKQKLATNVGSYLLEYSQYPVNNTYNTLKNMKKSS